MINILSIELTNSKIINHISNGIITTKIVKGKKKNIRRELLGDCITSNSSGILLSKKFIEKIEINKVNNGKYCIAFGYNPAYGDPDRIDDSNGYLIGLFENRYQGYYLINLFPDVAPKISKTMHKTDISGELKRTLINYEINNIKRDDIYIFAGSHFNILAYNFYYDALLLYNVFILTDSNNELKHIASLKHSSLIYKLI